MKISIGMTSEEVLSMLKPVPPGRYKVVFSGFLKDKDNNILVPTKDGEGTKVTARLKITGESNPAVNNRSLLYNCTLGTIFFARLVNAFPLVMDGADIDDEAAIGSEAYADVSIRVNPNTGEDQNNIDNLVPIGG